MRTLPTFLITAILGVSISGCKFEDDSDVKSSFAIDAGQDAIFRSGTAPTFVMLSDWFQKFKVEGSSKSNSKERPSTHALLTQIPKEYRSALVKYLDVQIERNGNISAAIDKKDNEAVWALLRLEVDEMYDIVVSLLNPQHKLKTDDLFAKFIKLAWRDDFVDQFAIDFTSKALSKRLLHEVLANLEKERDVYQELLLKKYKTEGFSKLSQDLAIHLQALSGMRGALKGELSLAQTDYTAVGMPAVFASFSNQYFQAAAAGSYGEAAKPSFLSDATETKIAGSEVEKISVGGGQFFPPSNGGNDPLNNGGGSIQPPNGGGNFDPFGPPAGFNNQSIIMDINQGDGFGNYLPANWYQQEIQTSKYSQASAGTAPNHDCRKLGLTGMELVRCQRYLAYTGLSKPKGFGLQNNPVLSDEIVTPQAPAADRAAAVDTSAGSNLKLIKDGASRVVNQGSVPSCTAASMAGTLESMAKVRGKDITLDHEQLWNAQGQQPMMQAAQQSARTAWAAQGVKLTSAEPITSLAQIIDGLNAGKPTHLGVDITQSWMAGGGGSEFGLTAGSPPIYRCQAGSGMGHAISVQGYLQQNGKTYLIIKNSWGASWGDNGFALVDPVSCLASADGAVIDAQFD